LRNFFKFIADSRIADFRLTSLFAAPSLPILNKIERRMLRFRKDPVNPENPENLCSINPPSSQSAI